jgi:DNA-binding MarR family transcriptional regulator
MRAHDDIDDPPALTYVIGRVNQGIRREMQRRLKPWGLTIPEYTTLSVLRRRPGLSNAQLSRRALITPQSTIEVLASLESRSLVRRKADPSNARIRRAELTEKGRKTLERADPAVHAIEEAMLADIAPRQRSTVLNALLRAMDRLAAGLGDEEPPAESRPRRTAGV